MAFPAKGLLHTFWYCVKFSRAHTRLPLALTQFCPVLPNSLALMLIGHTIGIPVSRQVIIDSVSGDGMILRGKLRLEMAECWLTIDGKH
jgi:hypothetical protein